MAFALLVVGIFLLVSAARNKQGDLFALVQGDFTGPNNFIYWFTAILLIGALGYIPKLKPVSVALLTLVIIVLVLAKGNGNGLGGGLFEKLTAGLKGTQSAKPSTAAAGGGQTPALIIGEGHPLDYLPPITSTIQ